MGALQETNLLLFFDLTILATSSTFHFAPFNIFLPSHTSKNRFYFYE